MNGFSRGVGLCFKLSPNCFSKFGLSQTLRNEKLGESLFCSLSCAPCRVAHDRHRRTFTVALSHGAGQEESAVLKYSYKTDKHVYLLSTTVPESFRGKGVASHLAEAALDFVVEERLKATIFCWYIQKYVDENPQRGYQEYIVED
ncbi:protein NATD1-like [Hoplias malabaricus]|uniref:protein NATD1-like n=1 Tax=Hoplias malabaricus TaxID=27720 RepID=UPI00346230A3